MKNILQHFRLIADGMDFGQVAEEVTLPAPTLVRQEYSGGAMHMTRELRMAKFEALQMQVKVSGFDPRIKALALQGPGLMRNITLRGSVQKDAGSPDTEAHVIQCVGAAVLGDNDTWQKGEKAGIQFMIVDMTNIEYTVADRQLYHLQDYPPKWIVEGVDMLAATNADLGF